MRIALDMDGCLSEFTTAFTKMAKIVGVTDKVWSSHDQTNWNFPFHVDPVWRAIDNTPNWWTTLTPLFSADETALLNDLITKHDVHIITNRKENPNGIGLSAREMVFYWLVSMNVVGIPMYRIHTNARMGGKGEVAKRLGIELAIDDHIPNLEDYKNHGIHAVAYDWGYNQDWEGIRVNNLFEFYDLVKNLAITNAS